MPTSIAAAWVLPIAGPPIEDATITVDGGRIVSVQQGMLPGALTSTVPCVVLPALVNAHTHLELSYLRGRIHRASSFTEWVKPMLAARRTPPDEDEATIAAAAAITEAVNRGTGVFGDVSNALGAVPALRWSKRPARVFHELLGFNVSEPEAHVAAARARIAAEARVSHSGDLRFSLAPHAPYSVSPALFDALRRDATAHGEPTTVHLAESREEVQFLADATGPWRELLQTLGVWTNAWRAPECSPIAYLQRLGFLTAETLIVHGVQCAGDDFARIRDIGATVVSCPRSNVYVGAGSPPLADFYAAGVPVAFGTDSLASVEDLNLFSELAEARRLAPGVSARRLLESATAIGAKALSFGGDYGTIEPGKRAALISVRLPAGVSDVEEYLVSGIPSAEVAWVPEAGAPASS